MIRQSHILILSFLIFGITISQDDSHNIREDFQKRNKELENIKKEISNVLYFIILR